MSLVNMFGILTASGIEIQYFQPVVEISGHELETDDHGP